MKVFILYFLNFLPICFTGWPWQPNSMVSHAAKMLHVGFFLGGRGWSGGLEVETKIISLTAWKAPWLATDLRKQMGHHGWNIEDSIWAIFSCFWNTHIPALPHHAQPTKALLLEAFLLQLLCTKFLQLLWYWSRSTWLRCTFLGHHLQPFRNTYS